MKTATLSKPQNYHANFVANVSPKEAFEKICHVSEWWTAHFKGSAEKTNDIFTIRFGETFVIFRIADAIPDEIIVWVVTDCYLHSFSDKTEWNGTKIVFEISRQDSATKIDMTHVGLRPDIKCYQSCEQGWDFFFKKSLYKFMTTGEGLPDTPTVLR